MYHCNIYRVSLMSHRNWTISCPKSTKRNRSKSNKRQSSKGTKLKGQSILKPFQLRYTRMQESVLPVWSRGSACGVQEQLSNKPHHFSLGYILVLKRGPAFSLMLWIRRWVSCLNSGNPPPKRMTNKGKPWLKTPPGLTGANIWTKGKSDVSGFSVWNSEKHKTIPMMLCMRIKHYILSGFVGLQPK